MHRRALLFLAIACLTRAAEPANVAKAGLDGERLARIPARMKAFVEKGSTAGVVTLVARHGVVAAVDAVGWQDRETGKPMRADTIFQIMSMTKPVTGVAVMMLAEEGKLALNDPVEKHLPEFRGLWVIEKSDEKTRSLNKPARPITIRDLMTHTSGMGDYPEALRDPAARNRRTLTEVVGLFSQQPLEFEPGSRWLYSNTGINTLGRIVEVVSDQPFERFLEERVFKPLGMKDTFFFPPADRLERIASVYTPEKGALKKADVDLYRKGARLASASGGLFSTASDMAAFYQMMLHGGTSNGRKILSKAGVEVMTALHTGTLPVTFGLTWAVLQKPEATLALQSAGSYGHGGAYGTYGWVDPKKDLLGVFLMQRTGGGGNDERNAFLAMTNAAVVD